jgi:hypothetical protein
MNCPDDGLPLREEAEGRAACGLCRGRALSATAFDEAYPGMRAVLAPERDRESGAFARERRCPRCAAPMGPHRIGELLAWVEVCAPCQLHWVERLDEPAIVALRGRMARARAAAAMPAEERVEMASELAGEVGAHERGLRRLRWVRQLVQLLRRFGL